MELDEYDDELPPISVNFLKNDESTFAMPSAEVLASQRARAEECERTLQLLNEQRERQDAELRAASNIELVAPSRSNSSGSEGETALLSAVESLRVAGPAPPPRPASPRALLQRVCPRLPPAARAFCAQYCEHDDPDLLSDDIITSIWSWLSGVGSESPGLDLEGEMQIDNRNLLTDDEVLGVGSWLCGVVAVAPLARAHRALQALLVMASDDQVSLLASAVVPALPSAALVSLRAASAPARPALGAALARAALHRLLRPADVQPVSTSPLTLLEICTLVSSGWKQVPAEDRELALTVIGRALAAAERASEPAERASETSERPSETSERASETAALTRALAALAQPAPLADKTRPDHLKIAVAASKLKILLSDRT